MQPGHSLWLWSVHVHACHGGLHSSSLHVLQLGVCNSEITPLHVSPTTLALQVVINSQAPQAQTLCLHAPDPHATPHPVTPPPDHRPGNLTITSCDSVPLLAPVGPYSMRMQAWDQGGGGVMCIDIWFRVVSGLQQPVKPGYGTFDQTEGADAGAGRFSSRLSNADVAGGAATNGVRRRGGVEDEGDVAREGLQQERWQRKGQQMGRKQMFPKFLRWQADEPAQV